MKEQTFGAQVLSSTSSFSGIFHFQNYSFINDFHPERDIVRLNSINNYLNKSLLYIMYTYTHARIRRYRSTYLQFSKYLQIKFFLPLLVFQTSEKESQPNTIQKEHIPQYCVSSAKLNLIYVLSDAKFSRISPENLYWPTSYSKWKMWSTKSKIPI